MGVAVKYLMVITALLLTIFAPIKVLAADCQGGSNMAACSDRYVCIFSSNIYKYHKYFNRASQEAANRGLPCAPKVRRSFLHDSFRVLSEGERKDIQSALLSLEMYSSTIDGLYGKGTAAALKAYNKEYLGNADLTQKANVDALFAAILKPLPSDDTQVVAAQLKPESATPEPKPELTTAPAAEPEAPITLADMQEAYNSQDYLKAREAAGALAVDGLADAQFLLGKMYADGLGTLQLSKNAHMWFNIASLNGSVEAIDGRNAIAATMSQDAVNEAQDMAVKCIQSNYADCGLLVKNSTAETASPNSSRSIVNGDVLISNFKDQSSLRRKQLQYALKKLGLYSSTVDGLWGNNTSKAFTNYIKVNELVAQEAEDVFVSILSKVDVPSSFTPPKKKQNVIKHTTKNNIAKETPTTRSGWTATSQNPKLTFEDARDICEAKAIAEGNSYLSANKPIDRYSSIDCTGYGFNSYSCSRSSGGGVAGGILRAWDQVDNRNAAEKLAKAVAKACMADYGWIKK